ncbi:hypothetical protein Btru_067840 [Bulinus truncatus]|nr:hypothetical protein Btru_067840 [Bulinus truncatus]
MDKESLDVAHFKCKFTEFDAAKILNFMIAVRENNSSDGRILYMCRNGALYSGLSCVLSLLLDRVDCDSYITVPLVVGSVKSVRLEVIPTYEQYRLLYRILEQYAQTSTEYGNNLQQYSQAEYGSIKSENEHLAAAKIYANV